MLESGVSTSPQAGLRGPFPDRLLLSLGRNPFFLGREEVLTRLRRQFQAGQTMALSQPQAICGLGGVGKTQLALEYAYRYAQDYQAIFWTRAASRDTLVAGLLEIASVLRLPERARAGSGRRDRSRQNLVEPARQLAADPG